MYGGVDINPFNGPVYIDRCTTLSGLVWQKLAEVFQAIDNPWFPASELTILQNKSAGGQNLLISESLAAAALGNYYTLLPGESIQLPIGEDVDVYVELSADSGIFELLSLGKLAYSPP